MHDALLPLLRRIRDGLASPDEVSEARGLIARDPRFDDEIREIGLTDHEDLAGDAAGLIAVLGADELGGLLARAIAHEAGAAELDLDEATLDDQDWLFGPDLVAAIQNEAGTIDIAAAVVAICELDGHALPIADAVHHEAGGAEIADAVIAWSDVDVAAAVRSAAGSVDVVDAVMAAVQPGRSLAEGPLPPLKPANDVRGFAWIGALLAAAAALFVVLTGLPTGPSADLPPMLFAHADEVVVEDLMSDTDVLMLQGEGQDGAFILWVDEET